MCEVFWDDGSVGQKVPVGDVDLVCRRFIETLDDQMCCHSLLLEVRLLSLQGGLDVFITSLSFVCRKASYRTSFSLQSQSYLQPNQPLHGTVLLSQVVDCSTSGQLIDQGCF